MKRLLTVFGSPFYALGCGTDASKVPNPSPWQPGGIYSIDNRDGTFGIVKILVLEPGVVHVRVCKNNFGSRPAAINVESLSLGSIRDPDVFGMGHLPISERSFSNWQPSLLIQSEVGVEELEGYKMWKEARGGVFE